MSDKWQQPELSRDVAADLRFGVVASRFNAEITDALLEGALRTLREHGAPAEQIRVVRVPGAHELPMGAALLAADEAIDAVVVIGALIRGETPHFDVLAHAAAQGVQDVAREYATPVTFGLITCDDLAQARARAGGDRGNKGAEAALAAIEMAALFVGHDE